MKPPFSNARIEYPADEVATRNMLLGTTVVEEWEEGGHKWAIVTIEPRQVGAAVRHYRLMQDGEPSFGGQYHGSIDQARERAKYVAQGSMDQQITYLWGLVDEYRRRIARRDMIADITIETIEGLPYDHRHAGRLSDLIDWIVAGRDDKPDPLP